MDDFSITHYLPTKSQLMYVHGLNKTDAFKGVGFLVRSAV
jgi:hypothetical protein